MHPDLARTLYRSMVEAAPDAPVPAPAVLMCQTMQRPAAECGCPDCGSSLVEWPAPAAQEPAAWLVHGGRTWADRVYLSHPQATQAVETRRDGSQMTALYAAPPAAERPDHSGDSADMVWCACGDGYPADTYDAGFIHGAGMCQNCDAAIPARDIQPDTVKVPRKLARQLVSKDRTLRAVARSVLRALLDKEGK